jgi:hypothetical protein
MTIEQPRQRIFDAIIWEAALCFSLPTWMLAGSPAWPANNPYRFAATVLAGATAALLLCHIVPAFFAHDIANRCLGESSRTIERLPFPNRPAS